MTVPFHIAIFLSSDIYRDIRHCLLRLAPEDTAPQYILLVCRISQLIINECDSILLLLAYCNVPISTTTVLRQLATLCAWMEFSILIPLWYTGRSRAAGDREKTHHSGFRVENIVFTLHAQKTPAIWLSRFAYARYTYHSKPNRAPPSSSPN